MKNILITGIRGFIGFNAILQWKNEHPECNYVGVDGNTYADKFMQSQKDTWLIKNCVQYYVADLGDDSTSNLLEDLISKYHIDAIANFAAESHVDNSLKNPNVFFHSNILGTAHLLNLARKHSLRFHQVSTDEVYGITYPEDNCYEDYKIEPSSPYSSSKSSADMIALSYYKSFGTKTTISRCSNNFGPWQMSEKLLPTVILKALKNEKIPVYGNGMQRRHWISVNEHNKAIFDILLNGNPGEIYNIAPPETNYLANLEIIKFVLNYMNKPESLIEHVTDRLGHDTSYYLYSRHYSMSKTYEDDLKKTIDWYVSNFSDVNV